MKEFIYEIDPYNRLVETPIGRQGAIVGMRRVLDGYFEAGASSLTYHLKDPVPKGGNSRRQVVLKGRWSLDAEHALVCTLDRDSRGAKAGRLIFKGELIDAKANSLAYSLATRSQDGESSAYLFVFEGAWQADSRNRLTFKIRREPGATDTLTFEGVWEVDKDYRLVYRHEKNRQELVFEGRWEIADKTRLSYVLGARSDSRFDFKAAVAKFDGRTIKYEVGIAGSSRKKPFKQVITFFGKWMFTKNLGLVFEAPCAGGATQTFAFGCQMKLSDKDTLTCSLRNSANRSIGVEVELARQICKGQGQIFLRLLEDKGSAAISVGAGWKW